MFGTCWQAFIEALKHTDLDPIYFCEAGVDLGISWINASSCKVYNRWAPNIRDTFRFRPNGQVITACPAGPDDANATLLSAKADWFRAARWREQVV